MIEYYESLTDEEKDGMKEVIQALFRQTFLLERKYDRRSGRMTSVKEYKIAEKHIDFLREYFMVSGISLRQNVHMGVIYIRKRRSGERSSPPGDDLSSCAEAPVRRADGVSVFQQPCGGDNGDAERQSGRIPCAEFSFRLLRKCGGRSPC